MKDIFFMILHPEFLTTHIFSRGFSIFDLAPLSAVHMGLSNSFVLISCPDSQLLGLFFVKGILF